MGRWTPQMGRPLLPRCCYSMGRWTPQIRGPLLPRCCYSMGRWTPQIRPRPRIIEHQHSMGRWTHQMVKTLRHHLLMGIWRSSVYSYETLDILATFLVPSVTHDGAELGVGFVDVHATPGAMREGVTSLGFTDVAHPGVRGIHLGLGLAFDALGGASF